MRLHATLTRGRVPGRTPPLRVEAIVALRPALARHPLPRPDHARRHRRASPTKPRADSSTHARIRPRTPPAHRGLERIRIAAAYRGSGVLHRWGVPSRSSTGNA
jgi:hypothetical protein